MVYDIRLHVGRDEFHCLFIISKILNIFCGATSSSYENGAPFSQIVLFLSINQIQIIIVCIYCGNMY